MTKFQKQIAFFVVVGIAGVIGAAIFQNRQGRSSPTSSGLQSPTPAPAASGKDPSMQSRELIAAMASGEIGAGFVRKDFIGTQIGTTLVIGPGRGGSNDWLSLENHSDRRMRVTCPRYLFAALDNWKNPYPEEGKTPEFFYFVMLPRDFEVVLDAHGSALKSIEDVWYLGNASRPPPAVNTPGKSETRFMIKAALADSPYVKAADALFDAETTPSVKSGNEKGGRRDHLAFALLADATPEKSLRAAFLKNPYIHTQRARQALRKAGLETAEHPLFHEAEKKHADLLASLKTGIEKGAPSAVAALSETATLSFATGDREIAALVAGCLRLGSNPDVASTLPFLLEKLDVREPPVLDALFACALKDASLGTRIGAASVGARLGDIRCAPILLQFQSHPVKDGDIGRLKSQATEALMTLWKLERPLDQKKWNELSKKWESPDIQGVPASDLAALREFLASRRNITPEDFEQHFARATQEQEPMKRHQAIEWIALSDYRLVAGFNDRMRVLFLQLAASDPDPMVRSTAVSRADYVGPKEKVEPALVACLKREKDPKVLKTLIYTLANEQSKDCVPFILDLLGNPQLADDANEVLRRMTRASPSGKTRADWEPILREKRLLNP